MFTVLSIFVVSFWPSYSTLNIKINLTKRRTYASMIICNLHFPSYIDLKDYQPDLTSQGCPLGRLTSADVQGCYWVSRRTLRWGNARDYCLKHNAILVSILSNREDTFVMKLLHGLELNNILFD